MKKKKYAVIRRVLIFLLAAVILYCAMILINYYINYSKNENLNHSIAQNAKISRRIPDKTEHQEDEISSELTDRLESDLTFTIDFRAANQDYREIEAWLYCKDTPIDYPVVQTKDNATYLERAIDGSYNLNGTLFVDYRNKSDVTDNNTIIYGHNMRSGSMFGTLPNYRYQDYYDDHPVMYLVTKKGEYAVAIFAGVVVPEDAEIYSAETDDRELVELVDTLRKDSTFDADVTFKKGDRIVTLSTCSYEYDGARFILLGKLLKL